MKKICTKCKKEKNVKEFNIRNTRKGTFSCWCKECFREYDRAKWKSSKTRRKNNLEKNAKRVIRNKQFVWDYCKKHPCEDCGKENPVVLGFDHMNPELKRTEVSNLIRCAYGLDTIKKEIAKCRVLCANCHMERTARQQGWYKGIVR